MSTTASHEERYLARALPLDSIDVRDTPGPFRAWNAIAPGVDY